MGAQTGKTQSILCCLGYAIDQDPGPTLYVMPNADMAKSFSEDRIQPLIDDCPRLRSHKPAEKDRYRKLSMQFDRMTLNLVGSNSPANLAGRPIRYLLCDETDKYADATAKEAAAIDLADVRTRTYWNRKRYFVSTPTIPDATIWRKFMEGDRRQFYVPCPNCKMAQRLIFKTGMKWDQKARKSDGKWDLKKVAESTYYECCHCEFHIEDKHKRQILLEGYWEPETEVPFTRSYQLPAQYSNWVPFGRVAVEFLESKPYPDKLRHFINSTLAEPWNEKKDAATEDEILKHRGQYPEGNCPDRPLAIIVTADVQKGLFYYVVRAWGIYETSWLLRYGQVETFDALQKVARDSYLIQDEPATVTHGFIDSGYNTDAVRQFCIENHWVPVKGVDSANHTQAVKLSNWQNLGLLLVNSDYFKDALQVKLAIKNDDPGAWLLHRNTMIDYAEQLCTEAPVEEKDKWGRTKRKWKVFPGADNHYLDCEVYQLAAAMHLGFRFSGPENLMVPATKQAKPKPQAESQYPTRRDGRPFWSPTQE